MNSRFTLTLTLTYTCGSSQQSVCRSPDIRIGRDARLHLPIAPEVGVQTVQAGTGTGNRSGGGAERGGGTLKRRSRPRRVGRRMQRNTGRVVGGRLLRRGRRWLNRLLTRPARSSNRNLELFAQLKWNKTVSKLFQKLFWICFYFSFVSVSFQLCVQFYWVKTLIRAFL